MMDDVTGGKEARQANRYKAPKRKYMDMLQDVADRKINEVCIELDDVENVSILINGLLDQDTDSISNPV